MNPHRPYGRKLGPVRYELFRRKSRLDETQAQSGKISAFEFGFPTLGIVPFGQCRLRSQTGLRLSPRSGSARRIGRQNEVRFVFSSGRYGSRHGGGLGGGQFPPPHRGRNFVGRRGRTREIPFMNRSPGRRGNRGRDFGKPAGRHQYVFMRIRRANGNLAKHLFRMRIAGHHRLHVSRNVNGMGVVQRGIHRCRHGRFVVRKPLPMGAQRYGIHRDLFRAVRLEKPAGRKSLVRRFDVPRRRRLR